MSDLRSLILDASDIETREVHVPEWGTTVFVRGMTAAERDGFEAESLKGKGNKKEVNFANMRARLLVRCLVDADGERIFTERDADALGRKSVKAVQRLYDVAADLSALSPEDVEDLVGNSEDGQEDDSSSA